MIKRFTIPRDELQPGDFPIEVSENYIEIYREIPEFGTSAELDKARQVLHELTLMVQQYENQAMRLDGLGARSMSKAARAHAARLSKVLRGEHVELLNIETLDELGAIQKNGARGWSAWLDSVIDEKLSDGTPLLVAVFDQNPELEKRLKAILEGNK